MNKLEMLDMWYKNQTEEVDYVSVFFNDRGCFYSGNVYISGKCVGDYATRDFDQLKRWFPHLDYKH